MSDDVFLDEKIALNKELESDEALEQGDLEPIPLGKMDMALEAITALTDIHRTISVEGVSTHDVQAIERIRASLNESGFGLDNKVSLEGYINLVTPYRSSLNVTVSNESILKTIADTIKNWIKLLYNAVVKALQWVKSLTKHDSIVTAKIKIFDDVAIKMHGVYLGLYRSNPRVANELQPYILKIGENNLTSTALPKCPATLVGFNTYPLKGTTWVNVMKKLYPAIQASVSDLDGRIGVLHELLESYAKKEPGSKGWVHLYNNDSELPRQVSDLADLFVEDPDVNYLVENMDKQWYDQNVRALGKREFYGYRGIYDSYANASNALSKINNIKLEGPDVDLELISQHIKGVNQYIKELNTVVELLTKLRTIYVKTSATMINFYIQVFDLVSTDRGNVKITDIMQGNWNKAERDMEELKRKVGLA